VTANTFTFDDIEEKIGVERIIVRTHSNQSSFEMTVQKLQNTSKAPDIQNSSSIYNISTSVEDQSIQSITHRFQANRSFAKEYDRVNLSAYHDGSWTAVHTRPISTEGEEWTYQAETNSSTYYAVTGQNKQEKEQEENQTDRTPENQTEAEPDDKRDRQSIEERLQEAYEPQVQETESRILKQIEYIIQSQETANTSQERIDQTDQQRENPGSPSNIYVGAIALLLLIAGYLSYRKTKKIRPSPL
jgi:PGF-pre-PGF domain-containing protein